jgi:serine protease Do
LTAPYSPGGFLGINGGGDDNGKGVLIESVVADSAAAKAGLMPKDRIIEFNGQKIEFQNELITRDVPPGRNVEIKVIRGGRVMTIMATLGRRQ